MSPISRLAIAMRSALERDRGAVPTSRRGGKHRATLGIEPLEGRALLASHGVPGHPGGATDPAVIEALAAEAYVWGLAPQFAQRFSTYNTTISAPMNALHYGSVPTAWNNAGTNAGDSSALYINGFMDFSRTPALVLTVPPSSDQYYVVNYLDSYLNTIGSIGTRTTPSDVATSYILVGPNSPLARQRTVTIHGNEYGVLASDTNLNWMLIRIATNTLADAADPHSVPSVQQNVVQNFALNTWREFARNGLQPVFPTNYTTPPPDPRGAGPGRALQEHADAGRAVLQPARHVGQAQPDPRAEHGPFRYVPGSAPHVGGPAVWCRGPLRRPVLRPAGHPAQLRPDRFDREWLPRPVELGADAAGSPPERLRSGPGRPQRLHRWHHRSSSTNYWTILNTIIGTYPNNELGYAFRSAIVLNGGSANVPADAVYPSMASYQGSTPLDGNNTYSITFTPPEASDPTLPADGIYPPLVGDAQGNPRGFWSITLYQPDPSEVAAPYISQASVLNTHYSTADASVGFIDAATDVLTVRAPSWGTIVASTPILFGSNATEYGLLPETVYYVASDPTAAVDPSTQETTYSFAISRQWIQTLSADNVPIQYSGDPGPIVDLQSPEGASPLSFGMVKPVSQLGSAQLTAGQLAKSEDGSLTIWIGPTLPAGAPASNWIPTPSTAYFNSLYLNATVSTALQLIIRMYYPTPGNEPPSILPYDDGTTRLPESYIPPALVLVSPNS